VPLAYAPLPRLTVRVLSLFFFFSFFFFFFDLLCASETSVPCAGTAVAVKLSAPLSLHQLEWELLAGQVQLLAL
jgi:hypothetical protein